MWPTQTRQCKYEPAQLPRETTQKAQLGASQHVGRFGVRTEEVKHQAHGVAGGRERDPLVGRRSADVVHREPSYGAWFQREPLWVPWGLWVSVPTIRKPLLRFSSLADHSTSFWNVSGCTGYVPTCAQLGVWRWKRCGSSSSSSQGSGRQAGEWVVIVSSSLRWGTWWRGPGRADPDASVEPGHVLMLSNPVASDSLRPYGLS